MSRLFGIELPAKKVLWVSLKYIKGIGKTTACKICDGLSLDPQVRTNTLDEETIQRIGDYITTNGIEVEHEVRRTTRNNVMQKIANQTHEGRRHQKGLPARTSRMRRNGKTGRKIARQFTKD